MILCLGTTPTVQRTMTFDRLMLDKVNRANQVLESASGKSLNVARTLHRFGHEVLATGFLGGDTGKVIREDLDHSGIPHDFVSVAPKTRTCTTVIDQAGGTVTELVEETRELEFDAYDTLVKRFAGHLPRARVVVLSGSLPPGAPPELYARCTRLAVERGIPVVLDGRGEPLQRALIERPTIVKPNLSELSQTVDFPVDNPASLRRAIQELIDRGPKWAIITDGPRDVIASDGKVFWKITPPKINAVNPIGSGDAFAAGLAMALLESADLPTACRYGAACGAANALNTPPGHGRPEDYHRLLADISISTQSYPARPA